MSLKFDYQIRGVDDWLCFVTDAAGNWHIFHTECDMAWRELRPRGPDGFDPLGVAQVALAMMSRGEKPRPLDPEFLEETVQLFGEAHAGELTQDDITDLEREEFLS